jgi:hypothetical protein
MGRISRNMIGCVTVLVWAMAAGWLFLAQHPIVGSVVGGFALLRLWVLVRDWRKGAKGFGPAS